MAAIERQRYRPDHQHAHETVARPMRSTTQPQKMPPTTAAHEIAAKSRRSFCSELNPSWSRRGRRPGRCRSCWRPRRRRRGRPEIGPAPGRSGRDAPCRQMSRIAPRASAERRQPLHRAGWLLDPEEAGERQKQEADRREPEDRLVVAATARRTRKPRPRPSSAPRLPSPTGDAPDPAPVRRVCSPRAGARRR